MSATTTSTTADVGPAPGWYPDYDAAPGWERFWDGRGWTDGRRQRMPAASPATRRVARVPVWVYVATAALVALTAAVLVLGGDEPATSGGRDAARPAPAAQSTPPPPASTPGPPPSESGAPATGERAWAVASVADGRTLVLDNGAQVRLLGIGAGCTPGAAAQWLASRVVGQSVTLTRDGADRDGQGHLLRFAALDGADVGLAMLTERVASAAGGGSRAASYADASPGCR